METVLPSFALPSASATSARSRKLYRTRQARTVRLLADGNLGRSGDAVACTPADTRKDEMNLRSPSMPPQPDASTLPGVSLPCRAALPAAQRRRHRPSFGGQAKELHQARTGSESGAVVLHIYDVMAPMVEQVNDFLRPAGSGIFHAGVEIFGLEWSFGGTADDQSQASWQANSNSNSDTTAAAATATILPDEADVPRLLARARRRTALRERRREQLARPSSIHQRAPWQDPATGIFSVSPRECAPHRYRESVAMGLTDMPKGEVEALLGQLAREWPSAGYDLVNRNCGHFAEALCQGLGVGSIPSWVTSLADRASAVQATASSAHAQAAGLYCKADRVLERAMGSVSWSLDWFSGMAMVQDSHHVMKAQAKAAIKQASDDESESSLALPWGMWQ